MDEANGPIVGNPLRPLFLGQKHNISGVEPLEVCCVEGIEMVNHPHEVMLDDVPTLFEEKARKAIRSGRLVARHVVDRLEDLLLGNGMVKLVQVDRLRIKLLPIEIFCAPTTLFHDLGEVVLNYFLFGFMLGHPTMRVHNSMDMVLSPPCIDPTV